MIIEKLKNKFVESKRGVLLLFDKDKAYEEELLAYQGEDFRVLVVKDNYFWLKYQTEYKQPEEKILLYHPFEQPKDFSQYPLASMLYSDTIFAIDEISELMAEFGISFQHRVSLQKLQRWIKPKKYKTQLISILTQKPLDERALAEGVVSLILEEKKVGNNICNVIRLFEILNEGEASWKTKKDHLQRVGLESVLQNQLQSVLGISAKDISYASLQSIFLQVKYNAIIRDIPELNSKDPYAKLKLKDDIAQQKIYIFFRDWQDDKNKAPSLDSVLENLGKEIKLDSIISTYGVKESYGIMNRHILGVKLLSLLKDISLSPKNIIEQYNSWQNSADEYIGYEVQIEFVLNAARFYELKNRYSDFIFNSIEEYLHLYTNELYLLDSYYRKAFIAYQEMIEKEEYEEAFLVLNKAYDQYLIELNSPWVKELNEQQFLLKDTAIKKQYHFYKDFVEPISAKRKVVIISDAFRYELAKELSERLGKDNNNQIQCTAMLSAIPSYTNLGMSNLLPNEGIKAEVTENSINYSINGIKTISTYREKILQNIEPEAAVINFSTLMQYNKETGRDFFRDKKLIYIYHNWMDAIGDKKVSEYYTFESSKDCISQLEKLVKRLYNFFSIGQILLTADHGFLFNYEEISMATSQPSPLVENVLKENTRFVIANAAFESDETYHFPLANTTNIDTNAQVIIPKGINRFRRQGNVGVQFVHGGGSLQEVIVPVLEIKRGRNTNAEEVPFARIDQITTINTSMVKFHFLQSGVVGSDYKASPIVFGIYDVDNHLISNEYKVEFNQTSEDPNQRIYEIKMEMKPEASKQKIGYLRAYREKDIEKLNAVMNEQIKINILELDEF